MPCISVIVPTRLRNHLLPRALRSLLAQTYGDFEILVVDDNPPEKRILADPALVSLLNNPKVRVLTHDQPRNAAAARNVGLREAQGEWIAYLDDDDAYQPAKLERQLHQAKKTDLPIGISGLTYHLTRRLRKRVLLSEYLGGSELLLMAFGIQTLFHRNTKEVLFDEDFSAGEDAYHLYELVSHFRVDRIFNVAESLMDIYPQPVGPRVNTNALGLWEAAQSIYRDFAPAYGPVAARVFLARAQLGYLKFQKGGLQEMAKTAWRLSGLNGGKELRFILNCFLFRIPLARRFLVS